MARVLQEGHASSQVGGRRDAPKVLPPCVPPSPGAMAPREGWRPPPGVEFGLQSQGAGWWPWLSH